MTRPGFASVATRLALAKVATFLAVGTVIVITVTQMDPGGIFSNTTTAGGDTGAHVATFAFLKTYLLPHFHVTGWDPEWYDGFPLYTFYFPFPDSLAAFLSLIVPANIAFKLMTVLGSLSLPVAAWAFGRLAGLEKPRPAALAAATLPFLFEQSYEIYGGNLYSTLAGEYAYSLGLSLAVLFLGLVLYGLRTGRLRGWAIVVLSACLLSHVLTAALAIVGALVAWLLVGPTRTRTWWMFSTLGATALITAFWWVPYIAQLNFSTNMNYVNIGKQGTPGFGVTIFPWGDRWSVWLAIVGFVIAVIRLRRSMVLIGILGAASALAVRYDPTDKLYNVRFLPPWFLCCYLLAGYAVVEGLIAAAIGVRWLRVSWWRYSVGLPHPFIPFVSIDWPAEYPLPRWPRRPRWYDAPGSIAGAVGALLLAGLVVVPDLVVGASSTPNPLGFHLRQTVVSDWANWNYSGYEGKADWPEYHGLVDAMATTAGRYGCGRAMWEYSESLNRFGTTMALMDLPMWTGGCVDSMEGLLFESASSTPFHFLNQDEMSEGPSDAMNGLNYSGLHVALGAEHLRMLGVRYYMASTPATQVAAAETPGLKLVDSSGPWKSNYNGPITTTWKIYVVEGSALVAPLTEQPQVLRGITNAQTSWLPVSERWYLDPSAWSVVYTQSGPSAWQRVVPSTVAKRGTDPPAPRPLPAVTVSDIRTTAAGDTLSFHVSRVGVPVVVRISYFPDWHAHGALGPYRSTPNLMVVIPTSHDVTLTYGSSTPGLVGIAMTLVGIVALVLIVRRRHAFTIS